MSRQFDVHSNVFAGDPYDPPYLVNLQADRFDALRTAVVAPLWPVDSDRPHLPMFVRIPFAQDLFWLAVNELAFVRVSTLGPIMGNVEAERDRIIRALDVLFTGH